MRHFTSRPATGGLHPARNGAGAHHEERVERMIGEADTQDDRVLLILVDQASQLHAHVGLACACRGYSAQPRAGIISQIAMTSRIDPFFSRIGPRRSPERLFFLGKKIRLAAQLNAGLSPVPGGPCTSYTRCVSAMPRCLFQQEKKNKDEAGVRTRAGRALHERHPLCQRPASVSFSTRKKNQR